MWYRFTARARNAIVNAREEANKRGLSQVGPLCLLIGLLRERESVAVKVLTILKVNIDQVVSAAEDVAPRSADSPGGAMQLSGSGKHVMDLAYDEARHLNSNYLGTEHLLLGILREEREPMAAQILMAAGSDLESIRKTIVQIRDDTA